MSSSANIFGIFKIYERKFWGKGWGVVMSNLWQLVTADTI
jgi:hypothetical protein